MLKMFQRPASVLELFNCTRKGNLRAIKKLISQGVPVDSLDNRKRTPLCLAVKYRHYDVIKFLVESGADVNVRVSDGRTPIYLGIASDSIEIVQLLIDLGANLDVEDAGGYSPYNYAQSRSQTPMLELLKTKE